MIASQQPTPEQLKGKVCQSCIERYGITDKPATKVWTNGHYLCEECYQPLLNNLLSIPSHFSDVIQSSEDVLLRREDFFNHHAQAIINLTPEQIAQQLEDRKKFLFIHRVYAEAEQEYINKVKQAERAKHQLNNPTTTSTPSRSTIAAKEKISAEEKQLRQMAKTLGVSVEQLKKMGAQARQVELAETIGTDICTECGHVKCECKICLDCKKPVKTTKKAMLDGNKPVIKEVCAKCGRANIKEKD